MKPYVIAVAGIPASGKTTYARHIAEVLHIPFMGKDAIKEKLYEVVRFDTAVQENSQLYGRASYEVFFHIAACLMKADVSFVLESNFGPESAEVLTPLLRQYDYRAMTVLFDADMRVLHKRFCERDGSEERHPGLASKSGVYNDFETFSNRTLPLRAFQLGEKITVDTSDFATVDYQQVDVLVKAFINRERGAL